MAGLSAVALYSRLATALALGKGSITSASPDTHPAAVKLANGDQWWVYLWTVTPDNSSAGRPDDEYKIQLLFSQQAATAHVLAGQSNRFGLRLSPGVRTALLGYSPDFGVFVGWEARLYGDFGKSPNVQVREPLLEEARDFGWAIAEPRARKNDEVRVAFSPIHLIHYLDVSKKADSAGLSGKQRELFMLQNAPTGSGPFPTGSTISQQRQMIAANRLQRSPTFSPKVRFQYGHQCAICKMQLNIIEAAHIIPVNDSRSTDEPWNGIALCPVHHRLFDSLAFAIRPTLKIDVNPDVVTHLHQTNRAGGIGELTGLAGKQVLQPHEWSDASYRNSMTNALKLRETISGF